MKEQVDWEERQNESSVSRWTEGQAEESCLRGFCRSEGLMEGKGNNGSMDEITLGQESNRAYRLLGEGTIGHF